MIVPKAWRKLTNRHNRYPGLEVGESYLEDVAVSLRWRGSSCTIVVEVPWYHRKIFQKPMGTEVFWLEKKKQEKTHRFEGELMFLFRNAFFFSSMGLCSPNFNGNVLCEGIYSSGLWSTRKRISIETTSPVCKTGKTRYMSDTCPGWAGTAVGRQGEDATLQGLPLPLSEMAGAIRQIPQKMNLLKNFSST